MPMLLLAATLWVSAGFVVQGPSAPAEAPRVFYVVSEPVSVRAEPNPRSRVVNKLQPFDVVSGRHLMEGWLRVEAATTGGPADGGWIPIEADNIVAAPLELLKARVFRVRQTKWPDRVKLDIVRGRIQHGFTADQVQLALGDPLHKELRQVLNDVAEAWTYEDRRVVFSHTGVAAIEELPVQELSIR